MKSKCNKQQGNQKKYKTVFNIRAVTSEGKIKRIKGREVHCWALAYRKPSRQIWHTSQKLSKLRRLGRGLQALSLELPTFTWDASYTILWRPQEISSCRVEEQLYFLNDSTVLRVIGIKTTHHMANSAAENRHLWLLAYLFWGL